MADILLNSNDTHQYIMGPKELRFQGGRAMLWVERSMLWGGCGAREQTGHSDGGVESEGLQSTSWGGDPGAVSLQILKQDIRLWSLLCEVGHTLHSPGLPASSEVSQPLKADPQSHWYFRLDNSVWRVLSCAYHRAFSSIPDLYLLERQHHPLPSARTAIFNCQMASEGQDCQQFKNTALGHRKPAQVILEGAQFI